MSYIKYQHVEKLGTVETEGIFDTEHYVQPKLDGSNGKIWYADGQIHFGSRNRQLSLHNDNAGFLAKFCADKRFHNFFGNRANLTLWGEYLAIGGSRYIPSAKNKFYVFDVTFMQDSELVYLSPEVYEPILDTFNIEYVPVIAKGNKDNPIDIEKCLEQANFLLEDGKVAEGIVIKNVGYRNPYGRRTWGKVVTDEYKKSKSAKKDKLGSGFDNIEQSIIDLYCTEEFVRKEINYMAEVKNIEYTMLLNCYKLDGKMKAEFIGKSYQEFLRDNFMLLIKKFKNPTIDFKELQHLYIEKALQIIGNEKGSVNNG